MQEKKIIIKVRGVSPLIMHNSQGADPRNHYTLAMADLKAKRKKTEADHIEIHRLSFLSSLYFSETLGGLYMPSDNIQKMILEAGRALDPRGAKKTVVGIRLDHYLGYPLEIENRGDLDALSNDPKNRYFKIVNIQKAKVAATRAIFYDWAFEFTLFSDPEIIDSQTVQKWIEYAGSRVGLGSRRPYGPTPAGFGRFVVEDFNIV